jgi:hypothetical protein
VLWLSVLGLGIAVPGAGAYVYWANAQTGKIGRATNEGAQVEPNFIVGLTSPNAVAVNGDHIYWSDYTRQAVGRAALDGSAVEPEFIKLPYQPQGVAVNANHVYWDNASVGRVGRANLNGTSPETEFVKSAGGACGLAVDSGHIYWADSVPFAGSIVRVGLDGMNLEAPFVEVLGSVSLCGVAVNTTSVYWTDPAVFLGTNIGRANLASPHSPAPSYIGEASGPCGIAILGSKLYWANGGNGTIGRANTDSSGVEYELFRTGSDPKQICGIAVDSLAPAPTSNAGGNADTTPPQTNIVKGPGKKLAKGKAKFAFSSSEAGSTFTCRLDSRKPAACRSPKSYSGLKPGRHTFKVWAADAARNKDPTPAKRTFRVPAAGAGA